ncbi:MAG: cytochrome c5 family protein [Granulosicoccus sp.]
MSGATDSGMVKMMGIVLGVLSVIAVVIAIAARFLSHPVSEHEDAMMRNALVERIKPVASVRTSADDLPVADNAVAAAPDDALASGEDLVNGACASCHIAGVAGAPLLGDDQAWAERREAGLDALVASVINGKGAMPARGGSSYSDEQIRIAVEHIAMFDTDESVMAEPADSAAEDVAAEDAAGGDAAAEDVSATDGETTVVDTSTEQTSDASVGTATALVVGAIPVGLTDNVKAQVDGVCSGCHLAGIANAPKHGDTAAWQERADKGLDALTQSVINGLNVMPARGGSTLTDEEIPIAIQYLMSK